MRKLKSKRYQTREHQLNMEIKMSSHSGCLTANRRIIDVEVVAVGRRD